MAEQTLETVRIDKWLWAVRLFKTRSLAAKACSAGHVKRNGVSVKSSKVVRPGDRIDVLTPGGPRIVDVVVPLERRVSATIAQMAYEDRTPAPPPKPAKEPDVAQRDRGMGRPSKRDRRRLDRLRGR